MLKNVLSALGVIAALILVGLSGQIGREMVRYSREDAVDSLTIASEKINVSLPKMLDDETRLERTFIGPGRRFNYVHTWISFPVSGEINSKALDGIEVFSAELKLKVCSNKELQPLLSSAGEISYSYADNNGKEIFNVVVTKEQCMTGVTARDVQAALQRQLERRADAANRSPPMDDEIVKFEGVVIEPGLLWVTNYSLPSHSSDSDGARLMRGKFRSDLIQEQCADPLVQADLERGITYMFNYRGNDGEHIVSVAIARVTCEDFFKAEAKAGHPDTSGRQLSPGTPRN